MKPSGHSEYHPMLSVLLNPVTHSFVGQEKLNKEWQQLNYTALPHYEQACEEYRQFETLLANQGISISYLPPDAVLSTDAIYSRDASIATNHGMILCNMGKNARSEEPKAHGRWYKKNKIPVLGAITSPGTLEGGDLVWLDESTLAVGRSYRSNATGIRQLKELLAPFEIEIIVVDLPHYKGPADVFHLMSVLSPVDKDLAVVYSPLLPIAFREELLRRNYVLVEVPEQEFDSLGCNVLAIAARKCIMVSGNPITLKRMQSQGCEVLTYQGEEISIKGGGGPTCLTRPLRRRV